MNLLAPVALAMGVTLPIVVVFYLLKVRRHDEEVSSTFLWNDLIRDLAAHEPLQRAGAEKPAGGRIVEGDGRMGGGGAGQLAPAFAIGSRQAAIHDEPVLLR